MSRLAPTEEDVPPDEGQSQSVGNQPVERKDNELCVLFDHGCPTAEAISEMASSRSGYGLAWLLLQFIKKGRCKLPFESLDLSDFSLSARKLKLLLTSIPSGPGIIETLTCGQNRSQFRHELKTHNEGTTFGMLESQTKA
uniref:Uncharacterized protein n=1 Tax=Chromera velia CCMP2878 TaxID=1169474 RepID=A0A0G4HN65_9ALVE|eukprot:Cvel_1181.t1-p1 / transcript=Cvel_1181.t1 / gene=Cvel_1181 / organism=Chromera_velia_CCMP2878 / gene_product=hypothetical protein / transcript_product=hypothetical protein / location=Cvel_scaffold39:76574-77580(+) / protein_length=139 / sequence_SO=supercontig / SO=protein_coding / is_pseudo=false